MTVSGENLVSGEVQIRAIDMNSEGQRIDNYLMRELKGVPKSKIYSILRKGEVRVNKKRIGPEYRLQPGDQVRIPPVRTAERAEAFIGDKTLHQIEQSIIYEDSGVIVVNKPAGLAVHGGSGVEFGLIESLRRLRPDDTGLELVHRLDRDTSGCILLAKKRSVLKGLHDAFRGGDDDIDKRYLALVAGKWPAHIREVNAPLLKNELKSGERMVVVHQQGKPSVTRFAILEQFARATLVEARPMTGRTHQIRVHAQFAGHPLLGDSKYGLDEDNAAFREIGLRRLFLHSLSIECFVPHLKKAMKFVAPLPPELSDLLEKLRVSK